MMFSNVLLRWLISRIDAPTPGKRHQVALHLGQHRLRQHGRPGGKVVNSLRHRSLVTSSVNPEIRVL